MGSRRLGNLVVMVSVALAPLDGRAQARRETRAAALATFDVIEKSIPELQAALASGVVTSRQLVEIYRSRIATYDKEGPAINAIVALNPEALAAADALDAERKAGRVRGPLHGIPVLVKDNYETVEMPTTAGSMALASFHPKSDAFQVRRLKDGGAIILGKTNMHELASGITNISTSGGQTKNPYDLGRNPGGSSGGTGAAIAANFAVAGMGSDTCGSIRNPASHNNLVGLRGTRGLSSRSGIVPLSTTQDIGGPIARSITDLAIMLDATVGADPADAVTRASEGRIPKSYRDALATEALKGARIGVLRALFGTAPEDQEVTGIMNKALEAMKKAGAEPIDVVVPGLEDLLRDSSVINAEFKFDFAEYLRKHDNPPVKSLGEILDRGLFHAALESNFRTRNAPEKRETDQYRRALVKRTAVRQAVDAVLQEHRLAALVYPTLRRKPARIGDGQGGSNCQLSATSGLPALGLPAGFTDDGLPIGMDLLGEAFSEPQLLSLGLAFEQVMKLRQPPFSTPALVAGRPPGHKGLIVGFAEGNASDADVAAGNVALEYEVTTGELRYRVNPERQLSSVKAIWLHRGQPDKPGAAVYQLYGGPGWPAAGSVSLGFVDRKHLLDGQLYLLVHTARSPMGGVPIPLRLP